MKLQYTYITKFTLSITSFCAMSKLHFLATTLWCGTEILEHKFCQESFGSTPVFAQRYLHSTL